MWFVFTCERATRATRSVGRARMTNHSTFGAFVLLVTFEDTTDDDVAHDTHRGRHSIRANLIWHVILGLNFCAVCALLLVKETPPRPQTARPML